MMAMEETAVEFERMFNPILFIKPINMIATHLYFASVQSMLYINISRELHKFQPLYGYVGIRLVLINIGVVVCQS